MAAYLVILGNHAGLAWVLANEKMAFTDANASRAQRLEPGNRLFLYTSRSAFNDTSRDRGRIIGEAEVKSQLKRRGRAVRIGERSYGHDCDIIVLSLAPFREGVELWPLVPELEVFPVPEAYSAKLRRPLLALPDGDAKLIRKRLKPYVSQPQQTRGDYLTGMRAALLRSD